MSARQLNPDEAEALWSKAKDLKASGSRRKKKKAIELAKRMINEAPNTPATLSQLNCFIADTYSLDLEEHDAAIEYYLEALSQNGYNWGAGERLGLVYLRHKNDPESAARVLQQTLDRGVPSPSSREFIEEELAEAKRAIV